MILLEVVKANGSAGRLFYADNPGKRAEGRALAAFSKLYAAEGRIVSAWTVGEPQSEGRGK